MQLLVKHFITFFILFSNAVVPFAQQNHESFNPLMADPSVYYYEGTYYLYGTGGGNKDDGFKVFISKDLKTWKDEGYVLKKKESFGEKGFWAPQVFQYQKKFYMAYTANENIAIAVADKPIGPFTQFNQKSIEAPLRMIDPYVFFDNGKIYLYQVRLQNGNRIFVTEIDEELSKIDESSSKECIAAEESWENTQKANWPVAEGPTVIKRRNKYIMLYSANDFRNPDYAVGFAVSKSPVGPWKKSKKNPVISRQLVISNGPGHGDIFSDAEGKLFYVFHTHHSNDEVSPRKTALIELKIKTNLFGKISINAQSDSFQFLKTEKK